MLSMYKSLGEMLVENGVIDRDTLNRVIELQKKNGKKIGTLLKEEGYLNDELLYGFLEEQIGVKFKHKIEEEVDPSVFDHIPLQFCRKNMIAPVLEGNKLKVYMSEPTNTDLINQISFISGKIVIVDYATGAAVRGYLDRFSGSYSALEIGEEMEKENHEDESREDDSPVVQFVNQIIDEAVNKRVSDIHIERFEKKAVVRYRLDGVLYEAARPDVKNYAAIISRIKIMAELDISEKRLPQDGRIMMRLNNREIDIRVSIIPTVHGENAVLRILDKSQSVLALDELGMPPEMVTLIKKESRKPNGMILLTGPTGSGKTTTLYSILQDIHKIENKILTIEDPVEYQISGISQVQVHADIGLTFASGLRSFLRHDPDVIMVGEIRDKETADIAVRAALTGHLVLSTIHTNDAVSSITRFIDMGLPPYILTSTINLVIAQRLVRRVCPHCSTEQVLKEEDINRYGVQDVFHVGDVVRYGKGCERCHDSGYLGRIPIFEWLRITDHLKKAIIDGASSFELKRLASEDGLNDLRANGLDRVKAGETTFEEIDKITTLGE